MSLSIEEQLRQSRLNLQREIRAALSCRTKQEKLALVASWKSKYSPTYVDQLIRVARNKEVARDILAWDLNNFKNSPKSSGRP